MAASIGTQSTTGSAATGGVVMPDSTLLFAEGCYFGRDENGLLTCTWENGIAVQAVKGASVDYVDPKFHLAVSWANNVPTYLPGSDFGRLVTGGVHATIALVIVGMRKVVLSFDGASLNHAELRAATAEEEAVAVPDATWNLIENNLLAFNALIDAAPTIMGCNGLSLLSKGHNYDSTDGMWARLRDALDLEAHVTALALADYEGSLFHDALHPISIEWKTNLVSHLDSALIGHVNGVVLKRMPGTPAGTALVFVLMAMLDEISVVTSSTIPLFASLNRRLVWLSNKIRSNPLDWCTNFQRAHTARNLTIVSDLEPMASVAYGVAKVLLSRRSSVLRSKALVNCARRHGGHETIGGRIGSILNEQELSEKDLEQVMASYVAGAGRGIENFWKIHFGAEDGGDSPFSDNEDEDDSDEEDDASDAAGRAGTQ